jgi:hypothetical protein
MSSNVSQPQNSADLPASAADPGQGVPASHSLTLPATYSFKCYGTSFDAVVARNAGGGARLTIRGDLGLLPFSAESKTARQYIRAIIEIGQDLPLAEITLSKTQSVILRGVMEFDHPPSPANAVAATAVMVIASKPFVDMVSTVRHARDPRSVGGSNGKSAN